MLVKWIRENQETAFGPVQKGTVLDVPDDVAESWIKDRCAVKVKAEKTKKETIVSKEA